MSAPKPASANEAPSSPHGVSAGAAAVVLAQVPTRLVRLQRIDGSVQAESQQIPSTQKPVPHCDGVRHLPPCGTGVLVGVTVAVFVAVAVTVGVAVGVLASTHWT